MRCPLHHPNHIPSQSEIVDQPGWPDETRKAVSALFRLEYQRSLDDMLAVLGRLVDWLKAPEQTGLRRTFAIWIKRVLLPSRLPDVDLSGMEPLHELSEMHSMLAERVKQWPQQWKEQGLEEGRREGRQQGLQEVAAMPPRASTRWRNAIRNPASPPSIMRNISCRQGELAHE